MGYSGLNLHHPAEPDTAGRTRFPGANDNTFLPRPSAVASGAGYPPGRPHQRHSLKRVLDATSRSSGLIILVLCISAILAGCTYTRERASDAHEAGHASIWGYGEIRTRRFCDCNKFLANHPDWRLTAKTDKQNILMISGGGAGGAFGVGVLAGWSASNSRPRFDVVTGVSTGALIAPFAFLGTLYDDTLIDLYTGDAGELFAINGPLGVFGSGILKSSPLKSLIDRSITQGILDEIAFEHSKGRRLLVLTTNLDAQHGVIWNMGAIAASGQPGALAL